MFVGTVVVLIPTIGAPKFHTHDDITQIRKLFALNFVFGLGSLHFKGIDAYSISKCYASLLFSVEMLPKAFAQLIARGTHFTG